MGQAIVKLVGYKNVRMIFIDVGWTGLDKTVILNVIGARNTTPLTVNAATKEIVPKTKSISTASLKNSDEMRVKNGNVTQR